MRQSGTARQRIVVPTCRHVSSKRLERRRDCVGRGRSQAKRSEGERDLELAQLSRRQLARRQVEEGEGGEEGRIEVVGRIGGWRAVQRYVEIGVKEGISGMRRARVR